MQIFKKKPKVTFWSTLKNLEKVIKPEPAIKYIPEWFRKSKNPDQKTLTNVKLCTGLIQYFSKGWIIPLWCDLKVAKNDLGEIFWETPHTEFKFSFHDDFQYRNLLPEHEKKNIASVIKPNCPFKAEISKGWNLMQQPPYYEFHNGWSTIPGVFPSSIYHELNQQIIIYKNFFDGIKPINGVVERVIPIGTPLIHLIPVPDEFDYEVVEETKDMVSWMIGQRFNKRYHNMIKCPYVKK